MNIITNRQLNIDLFSANEGFRFKHEGNDYVFPTRKKVHEFFQKQPLDTVKFCHAGKKNYVHFGVDDVKVFDSKKSLRKTLSWEYGNAWIEEKNGKKRYFVDESGWFKRSIREVSKEEFAKRLESPSTWQKVLGIGLGILALAPGAIEFARHIPKEAGLGLLAMQQKSPLLGTVAFSCLPSSADAQAMGTEFQVNNYTANYQQSPSVAPLNHGGFVVSWQSALQDGDSYGIFGQRYNANGTQSGSEFQVNTYTTGFQHEPSVAPLNDGGFVITWTSEPQDGDFDGIFGQRYDASGARAGTEFQVNTYTTLNQLNPSVAPLNDGGFIVTWASSGQDGNFYGIYGQRYDATGARAGTEFQINTYTTGSQLNPSVALLNDGGFVVIWDSDRQDGDGYGIYGQRYDATVAQVDTEFQVNTYTTNNQWFPSVAPLNDGGFVVSWYSWNQDGDLDGIYGQRYDDAGARAGIEFQVNTYTTSNQERPSIAPLNNGGFVITWTSDGQDGNLTGIYGQRYNATGARAGTEFQVNTYTTSNQERPSIAPLNDGGFVVTWESNGQDGSGFGIYGQRYDSNGTPVGLVVQITSSGLPSQINTSVIQSSATLFPSQIISTTSTSLSTSRVSTQSNSSNTQGLRSSAPSSTRGASVLTSSLSPSQVLSTSSSNLVTSGASLFFTTRELGTQLNPTSTQNLPSSASSSTSGTTAISSNSNQSQPYTSSPGSMRTLPGTPTTSSTSSRPIPSGFIYSVIDIIYEESYPIYVNGEIVGTYTISGGNGQFDSSNSNVITMHFNPSFAPEEEEVFIPLFSIPDGQATDWQSIQLDDTDFECLEPHTEINTGTSGDTEFGLVFIGANSCTASWPQIVAGILPIMMH